MRVYLAGPMRGIPQFNFPAFFEAEDFLTSQGFEVFNPARVDIENHGPQVFNSDTGNPDDIAHTGFDLRETMKVDLSWICDHAEAIAMMPGWENSKGATAEKALAECLGLEIIYLE